MQTDPQTAEELIIPDGAVVMDELPNKLAQELIEEQSHELHVSSGRSYFEEMIRLVSRGDDIAAGEVMRECIEAAGSTEFAQTKWTVWMRND